MLVFSAPGLAQPVETKKPERHFVEDVGRSPASEVETSKLGTWDTPTIDPFHAEIYFSYWFTASGKKFDRTGGVDDRKLFREHDFLPYIGLGLLKNLDVTFFQGYSLLCDKEVTTEDTDGPHHGEGIMDLQIAPRWRFYEKKDIDLSFAYMPIVTAPTGRRGSTDHLGPSLGYTTFQNLLVMTKNFGRFNLNSTLGFTNALGRAERTGDLRGVLDVNLAAGYQVFQWFEPEVEVHYGQDFFKHGKSAGIFDMLFGVLIPLNEHVRLDVGFLQDVAGYRRDQTTTGVFEIMLAI